MTTIASLANLAQNVGYPLMFLLIMAESSGLPLPGETALIGAGVLASQGKLTIEFVIPLAALAAMVGDNIGYGIGRKGGRWLLERPGWFHAQRLRALSSGEVFFARHGPKAVFLGRFALGLRVWASWLAGATRMRWRSFLLWNACGGIVWATAVGLAAYFLGHAAGNAIQSFGLFGLVGVLVAVIGGFIAHRRHTRSRVETGTILRRDPQGVPERAASWQAAATGAPRASDAERRLPREP